MAGAAANAVRSGAVTAAAKSGAAVTAAGPDFVAPGIEAGAGALIGKVEAG